ncbi:sensor histidine kinase [Frankia sp. CH37]|nr:sensor histidine kinase [Parafrankia sp. CH37]
MESRAMPITPTPHEDVPRRFRGPFARWPRAADTVLVLALYFMAAFMADGPGDAITIRPLGDVPILVLLVCAVASPALFWRRRAPLRVLGLTLVCWAALVGSDTQLGCVSIIALYAAGRYSSADWQGAVGVVVATGLVGLDGLDDPGPWWQEPAFGGLFMAGAWYAGRRIQLRRARTVERRREHAAENRRIVMEERARIARELHDVVAHRVSLMTVQASGARAVAAQDPQAALHAMTAVEEAGRQALDELRHLLGVLRPETGHDGLGPQPSLAELPRLIEQLRGAGVVVQLAMDLPSAELSARTDLFAYRIIQEALTNVLKHAGPGTRAEVSLRTGRNGMVIEVRDDGRGSTVAPRSDADGDHPGGHGLVGMRERALLLGGSLDAGPRVGGGFQVAAHLPFGGKPG